MANKQTEFEGGVDSGENSPGIDTNDRTEPVRGMADAESDDVDDDDDEIDEDEEDEGTF